MTRALLGVLAGAVLALTPALGATASGCPALGYQSDVATAAAAVSASPPDVATARAAVASALRAPAVSGGVAWSASEARVTAAW